MKLTINGEPKTIAKGLTLPQLVESLGLPAAALLVEHNGVALYRREWETCVLAEGDRLEFLRIAAGG